MIYNEISQIINVDNYVVSSKAFAFLKGEGLFKKRIFYNNIELKYEGVTDFGFFYNNLLFNVKGYINSYVYNSKNEEIVEIKAKKFLRTNKNVAIYKSDGVFIYCNEELLEILHSNYYFSIISGAFGFTNSNQNILKVNFSNITLWQFPLSELGVISGSNVIDDIDSFLGVAHNNIWFYTKRGRLIALDIQTGKIVWKFSSHHDDKLSGYEICQGLGWIYFNEKDKCIYSLSSFFFQKIDTEKFEITDVIDIRNGEFEPLKKYSIRNALLQGDYFTFIACDHNSSKYRFLGIFNYITKELVWEYEMFTADSDNELLAPEPLYMTDNRLFIKDFQNTLHIFEKVKE